MLHWMYMPEAAAEIIYTGAGKPPSWGERILRAHTPEAHYQDIMKKYFRVTDRLEGKSSELVRSARPAVEIYAKAAGWGQTIMELYLAGSAIAVTAILAGKGLKTAAGVFGDLARKHGSTIPESPDSNKPVALIEPPKSPSVIKLGPATVNALENTEASLTSSVVTTPGNSDNLRKKKRKTAKARRNDDRRRRGIPVDDDDDSRLRRTEIPSAAAPGGNGRAPADADTRVVPPQEIPMDRWSTDYDAAIGTDSKVAVHKELTLSLLKTMMMDRSKGGFFDTLAQAMAESNREIRKSLVEAAVSAAADAFGTDPEAAAAVQLLIEHMTSEASTPVSAGKI